MKTWFRKQIFKVTAVNVVGFTVSTCWAQLILHFESVRTTHRRASTNITTVHIYPIDPHKPVYPSPIPLFPPAPLESWKARDRSNSISRSAKSLLPWGASAVCCEVSDWLAPAGAALSPLIPIRRRNLACISPPWSPLKVVPPHTLLPVGVVCRNTKQLLVTRTAPVR